MPSRVLPGVPATDGRVTLNGQLPVETSGVTTLTLNGFDGDDSFTVTSGHPYTSITLAGGNPSASDTATLNGDGVNDIVVNLTSPSTVTGGGLGTVSLPGIEHATVNAATRNVTVNGTAGDDAISLHADWLHNSGDLSRTGLNTQFALAGVGNLTIDGSTGNSTLSVFGTSAIDAFTINGTQVLISRAARSRFVHEHRCTHGERPRCQRHVRRHARCEHADLFLDGENPIGEQPGDALTLNATGNNVVFSAGPQTG